jgi:hypothetical protein
MNEPVRIVADWLNNVTTGATSVTEILALSDFPKDSADSLPSNPTHYDSTRNGFAARGVFPRDGSVTYPCVVVGFMGLRYDVFRKEHTADAKLQQGEATVTVTVAQRLQDSDEGVEDVGYLVRAVKGSLDLLHAPDKLAERTRNGVSLLHLTSMTMGNVRAEDDDKLIGIQFVLTYATHETTPD